MFASRVFASRSDPFIIHPGDLVMFVRSVTLLALATLAADATAQVRASELATVSQEVDGTTITLEYSRPKVRGRTNLFGGALWWGHIWTPGANWATTLEVDKDVVINGQSLAPGKYSVWMVLQPEEWEVVFHPEPRIFHLPEPELPEEAMRFVAAPQEREQHVEMLTFDFVSVDAGGADIEMQWANTVLPMRIDVQASRPWPVAADIVAPYVGKYAVQWEGDMAEGDFYMDLELMYVEGALMAEWGNPWPGYPTKFVFLTITDEWFNPAQVADDGKLYDVWDWATVEFLRSNGEVTGFDVRFTDDSILGTAKRVE